jgi:hypothetical protein
VPWRLIGFVLFILLLIAGLITYVVILRRRLKKLKTPKASGGIRHEN